MDIIYAIVSFVNIAAINVVDVELNYLWQLSKQQQQQNPSLYRDWYTRSN